MLTTEKKWKKGSLECYNIWARRGEKCTKGDAVRRFPGATRGQDLSLKGKGKYKGGGARSCGIKGALRR